MTPSDDLSPPRRPIFFPVVIATVFLTIIGLTAGFFLGERRRNDARAYAAEPGQQSVRQSQSAATPETDLPREPCPDETREFAADEGLPFDLRQVLRIETDNGTVAWICEDPQRQLYYQGKTGGPDAPLVQRKNGLFLPGVTERATGEYAATASNGNTIIVNRRSLEIQFTNGNVERHPVVAVQ